MEVVTLALLHFKFKYWTLDYADTSSNPIPVIYLISHGQVTKTIQITYSYTTSREYDRQWNRYLNS